MLNPALTQQKKTWGYPQGLACSVTLLHQAKVETCFEPWARAPQVEGAVAQRAERGSLQVASAFGHVNTLRTMLLGCGPSSSEPVLPSSLANAVRVNVCVHVCICVCMCVFVCARACISMRAQAYVYFC